MEVFQGLKLLVGDKLDPEEEERFT